MSNFCKFLRPYPDVGGSKFPFFFINMTFQAPQGMSDRFWGSQAHMECPQHVQTTAVLVLSMTPRTNCLLYSKKNGVLGTYYLLSDSVSARL
jgi:hypothetical protein